jgi:hypothetical protein
MCKLASSGSTLLSELYAAIDLGKKRRQVRSLFVLVAVALLSAGVGACSGAGKNTSSARHRPSGEMVYSSVPAGSDAGATSRLPADRSSRTYLNDGDSDRIGDADGDNRGDVDNDAPWDYKPEIDESARYHDGDDGSTLAYGHPAGVADEQAVTAIVKRFYVVAAAGDGERACAMLIPSLAKAVPVDYGRAPGPSYLRGGKTCPAVMALLFMHSRRELSGPATVTGVLVNRDQAYALLGSSTMSASYITLQRQHGAWMINELLGSALL